MVLKVFNRLLKVYGEKMKTIKKIFKVLVVFSFIFIQSQLLFAAYCDCSGDSTFDIGIVSVTINSVANTSSISDYTYYDDSSLVTLVPGATYNWEIQYQNNTDSNIESKCAAYIDYDGDEVFNDDGCILNCETTTLNSGETTTVSGTFTVPLTAVGGATRMRIVVINDADRIYNSPYDCITGFDGETEDYDMTISTIETRYTISGQVTDGGDGVENVIILFSDGTSETTDSVGDYSHTVLENWIGTITPQKEGTSFAPIFVLLGPITDNTTQDFIVVATHTVSGSILTVVGLPIPNVSITINSIEVAKTDISGDYFFIVSDGWSGTVQPILIGFGFNPSEIIYNNVAADMGDQNYVGAIAPGAGVYSISGCVTDGGSGVLGVTLTGLLGEPVTDSNGDYTAFVPDGWTGTVVPSKSGYEGAFDPASRVYTAVTSNQIDQDYSIDIHTISGNITLSGNGLFGVTMSGLPGEPLTDALGDYSAIVPSGWSGTVTPVLDFYYFNPESKSYSDITTDQTTQDYIAYAAPYTISGTITQNGGSVLPGVVLSGFPSTTISNNDGFYLAYVPLGWSGTIIPQKDGTLFFPRSRNYSNITSNWLSQNYLTWDVTIPIRLLLLQ